MTNNVCPRCNDNMLSTAPALSRRDNKTRICSACGREEAVIDLGGLHAHSTKMLEEWQKREVGFMANRIYKEDNNAR